MVHQAIIQAKRRVEDQFLSIPGVVSVGVGTTDDGQEAIVVGVTEDVGDQLPATVDGYPVVVKRFTQPEPQHLPSVGDIGRIRPTQNQSRVRPVRPGLSMAPHDMSGCTSNFIFENSDGEARIGTNRHCVAPLDDQTYIDEAVLQPSPFDGGTIPDDRIGRVSMGVELEEANTDTPVPNTMDFAAVRFVDGTEWTTKVHKVGHLTGPPKQPELGEEVTMSGRTSGVSEGTVQQLDVTVAISYDAYTARLTGIIYTDTNSIPGDSGSPLVSRKNGQIRPLGITFAGGGENDNDAFHFPVLEVESHTDLTTLQLPPDPLEVSSCTVTSDTARPGGGVSVVATYRNGSGSSVIFDSEVSVGPGMLDTVRDNVVGGQSTIDVVHDVTVPTTEGEYNVQARPLNIVSA